MSDSTVTEQKDPLLFAAAILGIDVPEACRDGIAASLTLLETHARILDRFADE